MNIQTGHVGEHLRQWRQRRRLSQLDLALDAEISARHLSFMETGRSAPSRDMLMRLAERLDIPLRERNVMLVAGGFAPAFPQRTLDNPAMKLARDALDAILKAHEPNPALAIDRHWNLVSANRMVAPLLAGVSPKLLQGRINVMRLGLHPEGLASRTVNLHEWRGHLLERLHGQCETTADAELIALHDELKGYPVPPRFGPPPKISDSVVVPFQMRFGNDVLSFISTTMVFGTPIDVTLSELALEAFYPADETTAQKLREIAGTQ
jgi:transcriptional regulator with XRE-family HTH domain